MNENMEYRYVRANLFHSKISKRISDELHHQKEQLNSSWHMHSTIETTLLLVQRITDSSTPILREPC